ncbi:organic cation/carnitine transporter 7-like isoform X3 [Olea europaea var. sylvestris]|uniref:organic cation/carnitine transporter 7-like isoform X3 n=1 Tax=Olea europaea var. sylvestris TaxID=158386 RepID=UPI000C1D491B|nr:organic cation/carnitine transporter 7-like isoform X3 [Olea europaea var. sylvestris]
MSKLILKMGNQIHGYTLDQILSTMGFGTFQGLVLFFAGAGWLSEAMEMMLLSFIGPAVKSEWTLSPTEESLLTTAVFGGMLIGAYFWGFISDAYGRRIAMQGADLVTAAAGLLSASSSDYKSLIIYRSLLGFGVGGGHVFTSWFLEFIPASSRGAWMIGISTFWTIGTLMGASLAWIVMPGLGWRWLLALSSIPAFLVLLFSIFAPESPRYLYMKGRTNEALGILEKIALINRTELPTGILLSDQNTDLDEENASSDETTLLSSTGKKKSYSETFFKSVLELFSKNLLGTTLLLWLTHFGYTFAYYGLVLLITEFNSAQRECGSTTIQSKKVQDASLYIDAFINSSAELPGLVVGAVLVDRLGRKLTMEILTVLTFILMLPLISHQNQLVTTALLFGARMFISTAFTILVVYAKEVYPTSVRGTGGGLATSMGRIGGMVCPLVAVALTSGCHQTVAIILFEIVVLVSGISILLFPFETMGRDLSDM